MNAAPRRPSGGMPQHGMDDCGREDHTRLAQTRGAFKNNARDGAGSAGVLSPLAANVIKADVSAPTLVKIIA